MGWQLITYKMSYLQKTADQFLILIFPTAVGYATICCIGERAFHRYANICGLIELLVGGLTEGITV